jgi:hypothetical protein
MTNNQNQGQDEERCYLENCALNNNLNLINDPVYKFLNYGLKKYVTSPYLPFEFRTLKKFMEQRNGMSEDIYLFLQQMAEEEGIK